MWWAVVLLAGLRVGLAAGVGLGDDEAYTWQWSTRLDWRYFDHPPLIAWLVAASTKLLGHTSLAVRLPAVLCHGVTTLAVADWAHTRASTQREVDPQHAAALAALLVQLVPVFAVAGVFVAPDAPLLAAWAAVGALLARWPAPGLRDWLLLGLTAGVAALAKHVGFVLWLGILLTLLATGRGAQLRRWGPWLGLGVAVVVSAPTWLALVDGLTLGFHLTGRPGGAPGASGPLLLVVGQLLYVGVALVPLVAACARLRADLALVAPLAAAVVLTSPAIPGLPHWLAPVWLGLVPGAAVWLATAPGWRWATVAAGGLVTGALFLQASTGVLPLPASVDPTVDLWAWEAVAPELEAAVEADGAAPVVVVTGRYQVAAQAAWTLRHADAAVTRRSGRPDQYDRWRPEHGYAGYRAVVVGHDRYPADPATLGVADCGPPKAATARRHQATRGFLLWQCGQAQRLK